MEYLKFWAAKDLWELGIILAIFGVIVIAYFALCVIYKIKAVATKAANKWNDMYTDKEKNDEQENRISEV